MKKKRPIPIYVDKPSPAATDKAKPKRTAGKGVEAIKRTDEIGKGVAGEKPKTKLVNMAAAMKIQQKQILRTKRNEHKRPKNSAT